MPTIDTVISQVKQPELTRGARDHVIKFKEQYDEYVRVMNAVNADRAPNQKLRIASIREFIRIDLLENLSMTTEIPDVEDISGLSDELVLGWYKKVLRDQPSDLAQQSNSILHQHTMTSNEKDPPTGVRSYFHDIIKSLRRVGGSKLFQHKN